MKKGIRLLACFVLLLATMTTSIFAADISVKNNIATITGTWTRTKSSIENYYRVTGSKETKYCSGCGENLIIANSRIDDNYYSMPWAWEFSDGTRVSSSYITSKVKPTVKTTRTATVWKHNGLTTATCDNCGERYTVYTGEDTSTTSTVTLYDWVSDGVLSYDMIILKDCNITVPSYLSGEWKYSPPEWWGSNIGGLQTNIPVFVKGGVYKSNHINGQVFNDPDIFVEEAYIVDGWLGSGSTGNQYRSKFTLDQNSYAQVAYGHDTAIIMVKSNNPDVVIDWSDFPGLELDVDLNAPTIEVTRSPASTVTPTTSVTLTITAKDPDGHDDPKPISINGSTFTTSPATYTATENQDVTIVARDANGNTRSFVVNISNIDKEAPRIVSMTQNIDKWTKESVVVSVDATDDTKLAASPYKWEFTPNSTGTTSTGTFTSSRSYTCTENGKLRVQVKDAIGNTIWSPYYYVGNIDKTKPTATYTMSVPSGTKVSPETGVTVSLNLVDTADSKTNESSGLAVRPVQWVSSEGYTDKTERTYHANGTYNIYVKDAVGNVSNAISFTINQIYSTTPSVTSFTGDYTRASYVTAPVTLTVTAAAGAGGTLASKPYSWDGGKTWTSVATHKIYNNGEYTVMVRDAVGNTDQSSLVVSNIDPYVPTANVLLYKGIPAGGSSTDDPVWKIRVEAEDIGSGIDHIETLWDSGTYTTLPITFDVTEAGVYGVLVYDKAGNQTYAEKVVTNESIGVDVSGNGANNAYTEIKIPTGGSAGSPFSSSLQDLVFGKKGGYNKTTNTYIAYPASAKGIPINLTVVPKRNSYTTGYATFDGVRYTLMFGNYAYTTGTGRDLTASILIPISSVTRDMRNGRIQVVVQEWTDSTKTTLVREGSATLYTSTQISDPVINYTYNRATDKLTVVATSTVAGIKTNQYKVASSYVNYTTPFSVGSATTVSLKVTDNCSNTSTLNINAADLDLNGGGGGTLPTEDLTAGGVNSYHMNNRAADIYIIGGTRGNTNTVPAGDLYDLAG